MQKLYSILIAFLFPLFSQAQVVWDFTTANPTSGVPANSTVSAVTQGNNNGTTTLITSSSVSSGYAGASGGNNAGAAARIGALDQTAGTGSAYFEFTITPAAGAAITVSQINFGSRSTSTGPKGYDIRTSLDGYTTAAATAVLTSNSTWALFSNAVSLTGATDQAITIRIYGYNGAGGAVAGTANWRIDDLAVTAGVSGGSGGPTPSIVASPSSLTGFTTTAGTASTAQSTGISGSNLTADITATAPTGYEVSTDNTNFSPSIVLTQSGGTVNNIPVYVRISAGATAGAANGNLTLSSAGATAQTVSLAGTVNANTPVSANIVINQIYGGGGNSGAFYTNDFIELYNNENFSVNLSGWSVQYSSATGSGWSSNNTALSGTIPAHGFFLIQESTTQGATSNLPAPDLTGTIAMGATAGKVILCNTTAAQTGTDPSGANVIDKVGYGSTANGFEGSPTAAPSNTTSVRRVADGVDNNNNATDFVVGDPLPRNKTYTTSPPAVTSLSPVNGAQSIPYNFIPVIGFNKPVSKGSGNITLIENGVSILIDVNSPTVVIGSNSMVTINTQLAGGKTYSIEIDAGAFKDVYGNAYPGLLTTTGWTFTTFDNSATTPLPASFDFETCSGSGLLPNGFTQYNATGTQVWDCTAFGRDPNAPAGTTSFGHAVQINGFANGINNFNSDWLISPKFDLSGTDFPLLSFWSRNAFAGDPLQLKISTDYTGVGDPRLATWTDLNGKFPSQGSDVWTQSSNINLSPFKQNNVYIAWVYSSTTDDGSRWTLDDVSLINSPVAPPPSLTLSTNNLEFGYTAGGNDTTRKLTVIGNDLTADITLSTEGGFLVSTDSVHFAATAILGKDSSNNVAKAVFVRFAPLVNNTQFIDSLMVSISDSVGKVNLKGNTIDPASILSVVDWNLNWFGTPEAGFGPADKALQEQNVGTILPTLHADIYALQEVVNEPALANIVASMPGYAYVINNYGSYSNTTGSTQFPLNTVQKLAFVYNTAKIKNIHTDSLLSIGVNTAADAATTYYDDYASGRYPYMLTADVSLSDNNGGTITKQMRFINIHAKANTAPVLTAYARRKDGAHALDSLIKADYVLDNVAVLGDFNDDLNQTITAGVNPPVTSYSSFTIDDSALYSFPTMPLSPAGQHSDVNFTSVIDNVVITKPLANFYLPSSATVLSDVSGLVSKYSTTTTDHYPVFTQYSFAPLVPSPVKLLDFTAVRQGNLARLNWTTTDANNSKQFIIERSTDNVNFSAIGIILAKSNGSQAGTYTFYDLLPKPVNYYRLKEVVTGKEFDYSKTIRLDFPKPMVVSVAPNPAFSFVNITVQNTNEAVQIQLIDLNGRVVKEIMMGAGVQTMRVDLSRVPKGIYTVKATSISGIAATLLLVL
ncbi:MAG TPA: choice-of-anchor J domain-containing protein [Puia sp.]|nr:choice-of-anchor J domain-containing protein [Puia sp.]